MLLKAFLSGDNKLNYQFLQSCKFNLKNILFTDQEVINKNDINFDKSAKINLPIIENDVSGLFIKENELSLFSAKYSKSRLYYTIHKGSIYISFDLRSLLSYSNGKLNTMAPFSIMKFGELPEAVNMVDDIYTIPSSSFFSLNRFNFEHIIKSAKIDSSSFTVYKHIIYSYSGGNLNNTKQVITQSLEYFVNRNPNFLVSGGIDSTLLIQLYYRLTGQEINAHFINFKDAPEDFTNTKRSLKGTKNQLNVHDVSDSNFINNFEKSIDKLIYPVYDNGSAFTGYNLFNSISSKNKIFIEGTLADSCYGVRDYNKDLPKGNYQPQLYSVFKEWLYFQTKKRGLNISSSKPRDSFINSNFIQDLLWNSGPSTNFFYKNAKKHSQTIEEHLLDYLKFFKSQNQNDYWAQYTVIKLFFYAGKQTTVKTYDMKGENQVFYPFMFNSIMTDQGRYMWNEKSENNIIKYPLKKILEEYQPKDFIYRKKEGLKSQTLKWIKEKNNRDYLVSVINRKDSLWHELMGDNLFQLIRLFKNEKTAHLAMKNILSMVVIQKWINLHKIRY